jgi:two-component system, chemotaxis family, protein-glutamate methylesterase/glutaminase
VHRDLVVIGCSAGCIPALSADLLGTLPRDFAAAVCIVMHMSPDSPRVLAKILGRKSLLPVAYAETGMPVRPGNVYVAPPDHHFLLVDSRAALDRGPRENRHRPAVDPLFRTAAAAYGNRVIAVVLTGTLDDGSRGLIAIKDAGGIAVVQDPHDAVFPGMPEAALSRVAADHCLVLSQVAPLLVRLTREELKDPPGGKAVTTQSDPETGTLQKSGPDLYTCPECGGPLRESNGRSAYFQCLVGHAYSLDSVLRAQSDHVETSLWAAAQSLLQQASIRRRVAADAERAGRQESADHFREQAEEAEKHAAVVRGLITGSVPEPS